jgi:hypothetical protein
MRFKFLNSKFSNKKIREAGICALVFLLPWQTRWIVAEGMINGNASEYLTLSLYGIDLVIISILLIKLISYIKSSEFRIPNFESILKLKISNVRKYIFIIVLFVLWNCLSIFWAADKMLAGQRAGWLFLAIGLVLLVYEYKNKAELIFWLVVSLTLSAILGIWQFLTQFAFSNKWLGLGGHNPADGGVSVVGVYSSTGEAIRWLRAYGSFDHPNIFGAFMLVGIILASWVIAQDSLKKWRIIFLYVAILCMSAGLFMSLSRSAWVGFLLALMVLGIKYVNQKNKSVEFLFKPIIAVVIIFLMLAIIYPNQLAMRTGGNGRLEIKSVDDRRVYLIEAVEMIKENTMLGVGSGNYIVRLQNENPSQASWVYQPVHNIFLYIWAELGAIGFVLSVTFMLLLGILVWKKDVYFAAIIAALIPSMFLDHWLWDLHSGIILLGFLIGLFISKNEDRN